MWVLSAVLGKLQQEAHCNFTEALLESRASSQEAKLSIEWEKLPVLKTVHSCAYE